MKKIVLLIIALTVGIMAQSYQLEGNRQVINDIDLQSVTYGSFNGVENYVSVPDNDNLDFGTGDFSLVWYGSLPDYTPSAVQTLIDKVASNLGYQLQVSTTGTVILRFGNGTNLTTYSYASTVALPVSDGGRAHIVVTADRDGNATFYCNGIALGATVAISGSSSQTVSSTGAYRISYDGTTYVPAKIGLILPYNRLLTASEVTTLYNNGRPDLYKISYGDRWGSQTNKVVNGTFDADANWTKGGSTSIAAGVANITTSETPTRGTLFQDLSTDIIAGKRYRLQFNATAIATNLIAQVRNSGGTIISCPAQTYTTTGVKIYEFVASAGGSDVGLHIQVDNIAGNQSVIDDVSLHQIGAVAYYKFNEGNGYQCKDYSSNALHGTINGTNYPTGFGYSTFWMNPVEQYTQEYKFADEGISASASTTALFKVVPKTRLMYLDIGIDTAFTAGDTVWVKDASGNILATIGNPQTTGTRNLTLNNTYAVSYLTEKQIYIQKNKATTAGYIRFAGYFQCFREESR